MKTDIRYVNSIGCSWHGPIQSVGNKNGLPCCPYCKSMLYELESKKYWDDMILLHEQKGNTNYKELMDWSARQPRCWKTFIETVTAFEQATGKKVVWQIR